MALVSMDATSRKMRGRRRRRRHAVAFSAAVISSSAPAWQKANEAGAMAARAAGSSASKSTLSIRSPHSHVGGRHAARICARLKATCGSKGPRASGHHCH